MLTTLITIYVLGTAILLIGGTIAQAVIDRMFGPNLNTGLFSLLDDVEDAFLATLEWPLILVYCLFFYATHLVKKLVSVVRTKLSKSPNGEFKQTEEPLGGRCSCDRDDGGCDFDDYYDSAPDSAEDAELNKGLDTDFDEEGLSDEEYAAFLDSNDLEEEEPTLPAAPVPAPETSDTVISLKLKTKTKEKKAKKSKKAAKKGKN